MLTQGSRKAPEFSLTDASSKRGSYRPPSPSVTVHFRVAVQFLVPLRMELIVMLVEPLSEMVAAFNTAPFRSHVFFDFA